MVLNGSVLPSKPPPRGFQLECHGAAGRDDVAPGASTMVLEGSPPFSLPLFTEVRGKGILRTSPFGDSEKFAPPSSRRHYAWCWQGSAILLDPVAFLILLVLVLNCAPGHAVGAIFLTVLLLGGVEGLLIDLLGVLWQVVLDALWQLRDLLVRHRTPLI